MDKEAFKNRMQQYKTAREQNPQLKYWEWKKYADGGVVEDPPTSERPISNFNPKGDPRKSVYGYNPGAGYTKDVFDLYDAPVVGDALSLYDTGKSLYNKDWVNAGISALAVLPFVAVPSTVKRHIPTVTRSAEQKINALLKKQASKDIQVDGLPREVYEQAIESRNRVYESMSHPENLKRAKQIDTEYGTDYYSTYNNMINQYEDPVSYVNELYKPMYKEGMPSNKIANVNLVEGNNNIELGDLVKDKVYAPNEQLIRHEIGHRVDYNATKGKMRTNKFMQTLNDDVIPYKQAKYMMDKNDYDYLTRPSEIKSHMNEFRQYLIDEGVMKPSDKIEDVPNFFTHLYKAPDRFNGIRKLQNLFKSDKRFKKRFDSIPLTSVVGTAWLLNNYQNEKED